MVLVLGLVLTFVAWVLFVLGLVLGLLLRDDPATCDVFGIDVKDTGTFVPAVPAIQSTLDKPEIIFVTTVKILRKSEQK